ncbi:MAG: DUF1566 domain-containing protein [Rikenellaceae bacterium]
MTKIMGASALSMFALAATISGCVGDTTLSYPQVATGQETLYNVEGQAVDEIKVGELYYGQDANYLAGAKMSYRDNGDGTVSDLNTGLMWQMVPIKEGFTWEGAKEYCEGLELAGYDDWRMPSAKELFSISDFSTGWPYIDLEYFKLVDSERIGKDEQYWTDHIYVGTIGHAGSATAFGVNHGTGHIKAYGAGFTVGEDGQKIEVQAPTRPQQSGDRSQPQASQGQGQRPQRDSVERADNTQRPQARQGQRQGQQAQGKRPERDSAQGSRGALSQKVSQGQGQRQAPQGGGQSAMGGQGGRSKKYVRAVRGDVYGVNKFVDNGDGTVTDKATGLMWSKEDSQEGMDWVVSLQYAESSELAGYDDWRLPNVKELQGILSYDYAPAATDPAKVGAAIDPIFSCTPIENENGDKDYAYYWTGTSALFQRGRPYYYAWYVAFGRAVSPTGEDSHGAGAVRFDTKQSGGPDGEDKARIYNYVRLVRNVM